MRFIRVPYIYLPTSQIASLYSYSYGLLKIIHDVHHEIPNDKWRLPYVKAFMYHASFVRWVFVKSKKELVKRGTEAKVELSEAIIRLKSKPLSEFVPPTDADIAEDIVWLLESWKTRYCQGGIHLPMSYVELAKNHYGYSPQGAANERIEHFSGSHRDADREWYHLENEEQKTINPNSVGSNLRGRGHAQR